VQECGVSCVCCDNIIDTKEIRTPLRALPDAGIFRYIQSFSLGFYQFVYQNRGDWNIFINSW